MKKYRIKMYLKIRNLSKAQMDMIVNLAIYLKDNIS